MTTFEEQVLNDLATLTSEMKALLGNGQPGRLRQLEQRVDKHENLGAAAHRHLGASGGGLDHAPPGTGLPAHQALISSFQK